MNRRRPKRCEHAFGIVLLAALTQGGAATQPKEPSADEIIRYLTYQTRPGKFALSIFDCGLAFKRDQDSRAITTSLVRLGSVAVPEIEKALDSLATSGEYSAYGTNAGWLLYAYAKIKGPGAYTKLSRLLPNAKLDFVRSWLDGSIALSLGLTSYVDGGLPLLNTAWCRHPEPRDALNLFILSWERNDRRWLQKSLGPHSLEASRQLTPADMPSNSPPGARSSAALGYRLRDEGPWSESEITPDRPRLERAERVADPEIETEFTNRSGISCGVHRLKFVLSDPQRPTLRTYLIDNSDLRDLFRILASCATVEPTRPSISP